jgi:hypothetical protein
VRWVDTFADFAAARAVQLETLDAYDLVVTIPSTTTTRQVT